MSCYAINSYSVDQPKSTIFEGEKAEVLRLFSELRQMYGLGSIANGESSRVLCETEEKFSEFISDFLKDYMSKLHNDITSDEKTSKILSEVALVAGIVAGVLAAVTVLLPNPWTAGLAAVAGVFSGGAMLGSSICDIKAAKKRSELAKWNGCIGELGADENGFIQTNTKTSSEMRSGGKKLADLIGLANEVIQDKYDNRDLIKQLSKHS